jgi:uncharacterized membrane protein
MNLGKTYRMEDFRAFAEQVVSSHCSKLELPSQRTSAEYLAVRQALRNARNELKEVINKEDRPRQQRNSMIAITHSAITDYEALLFKALDAPSSERFVGFSSMD